MSFKKQLQSIKLKFGNQAGCSVSAAVVVAVLTSPDYNIRERRTGFALSASDLLF